MYPDPLDDDSFSYPLDGLLPLQDIMKDDELRRPTTLDPNGVRCLYVAKNGASTGMTIGRASGMRSFVREYFPDGTHRTSVELAIYPYGLKDGVFSAPGDSGSIIADPTGRIVGMLSSGTGQGDDHDVTYATPFYWLFDECIKKQFPEACLYPATAAY